MVRRVFVLLIACLVSFSLIAAARPTPTRPTADDGSLHVKAAVARAAGWIKSQSGRPHQPGHLALMVHALAKISRLYPDIVSDADPALAQMVAELKAYCPIAGFIPAQKGGHDNYEAGCVAMALSAAGGEANRREIEVVARYIIDKQLPNGAWDYDGQTGGDTSMTQYALLGLWEAAAGAGVEVPLDVWDRAALWLVKTQLADGGFEYHPPENAPANRAGHATHTMTVASWSSLYICRDQLPFVKRRKDTGVFLVADEPRKAAPPTIQTTPEAVKQALDRGHQWIANHFTLDRATGQGDAGGGRWFFYYLYAFERFATLASLTHVAGHAWYEEASQLMLARQQPNGSWSEGDGPEVNTSFAVLFLVRSTGISQKKHRDRLIGRGTQIAGHGLPRDLSEVSQRAGGIRSTGRTGSAGKLLVDIASGGPDAERAAVGLDKQLYQHKWTTAGEQGAQLKRALDRSISERNSEGIKATLKALALTNDLRVVPLLIDGMYYEHDPEVQLQARKALCLISRKFNGFGSLYPDEATAAEWQQEIDRWVAWYRSVRPEAAYEDEPDMLASAGKR
jgi:hypothetical protein